MPDMLDMRAKSIIDEVIDMEEPSRTKHIERACKENPELRQRVQSLLSMMGENDLFLHEPTVSIAPKSGEFSTEEIGAHIGPYTLIELIGEGGFGSVYLAEQSTPVRRRVALKIIKLGMDTKQVIARFEAERQALALMDHPNIARVLDAGATHSGRPYFVMELVRGEPITKYCDREKLTLRHRLELFRDVCNAVQHAHQKGIIHRDLKPSNVLVSESDNGPLPKVIDFGIAKATAGRLTELTLHTEVHQLVGTPEYMSPEQAESTRTDIDTRSDVYSLGILLYELLTGYAPFDRQRLHSAPFTEVQRILREEEPPRPSIRLATLTASLGNGHKPATAVGAITLPASSVIEIAQCRQTEPMPLTRAIRGDLDWIVLKCLEKDRSRRYETASALADDVARYLANQPVLATPPSTRYRFNKFVRRNRGSVLAATAISLALIAGTVVSLVFAKNAARRTKELEQVAKFQGEQFSGVDALTMGTRFRTDLLEKVREAATRSGMSPDQVNARVESIEALLAGSDLTGLAQNSLEVNFFEPALKAVDKQFSDQPLVRAYLFQSIGCALYRLGLYDDAYRPLKEAMDTRKKMLGDKHYDSLRSTREMGDLLLMQGKLAEAESYLVDVAEKCRRALGDDHLETIASILDLGQLRRTQGDRVAAEVLSRKALDRCRNVEGENGFQTLTALGALGLALQEQGKLAEAEPYLLESLQKRRQVLGEDKSDTLAAINNLGVLYWAQGRMEEAEPYFLEVLEKSRRVLGDEHPHTLSAMGDMGLFFRSQGKLADAEALYREVLAKRRRILGNDHPDTQTLVHNMGFLLQAQGKPAEAEVFCREALDTNRRILGVDHPETLTSVNVLGLVLLAQGKLDEAEPLCREAFEKRQQLYGDEHSDTLISMTNLGALLVAQKKPQAAIELLQPAEQYARKVFTGGNAIRLARFLTPLGVAHAEVEEFEAAEAALTEASQILNDAKGTLIRDRTETWGGLVKLYAAWDAAVPDAGYGTKAFEWRSRLIGVKPSP